MKIRKIISLLFCLVGLNIILFAQPALHIVEKTIDFGQAKYSQDVLHTTINLVNTGTENLVVSNIRPGCGCTVASIPSGNIKPGDTIQIPIELTIKNFTGIIRKDVFIMTNDPKKPVDTVSLVVDVLRAFEIVPKWLAFDRVVVGEPSTTEVIIKNHSDKDAVVKNVVFSNSNIICDLNPNDVLAKGESRRVKFTAIATEKGSLRSEFTIELYHTEESSLKVLVYGNAIERNKGTNTNN